VTIERFEGNDALCTLTLVENDGRTTLTQTMKFADKEARDQALETGMTEGMGMSYDRLAEIVEGQKVA
jgi:Activator of Hsp90 ATPase homolog 1-like protein.